MDNTRHILLESLAGTAWRNIGIKQHFGFAIPLFALHSRKSCGIGEFPDLIPLIDWCKRLGIDVIQLLPLNDSGNDPSPYNALSATALNPVYLGLATLPYIEELPELAGILSSLQQLSLSQRINYTMLYPEKDAFLRQYFKKTFSRFNQTDGYLHFVKQNPWLEGYALFKSIKIERHRQSWKEWPEEYRDNSVINREELMGKYQSEIIYHIFIQFLCFQQFELAKKYANHQGVFIKGDIPILINYESADVWQHSELFNLEYGAGAPPDMYAKDGQYWGFPIYNWGEMEKQNFQWWRSRLQVASQLYDIYRIDHVVGFYRIWAISRTTKKPQEGKFIPENPAEWISQGEKIMRMMLETSSMLPIAEDLGVVPPEVRLSLKKLGICGTKVMRWERLWDGNKQYIKPEDYPKESMTTVSTHDSEMLTLWWKNDPENAKEYAKSKGWPYPSEITHEQLKDILWNSNHSASLFHINLLNEYFALVPGLTWPNLKDERINIPGTISDFNWSYRFKPSVEEIISHPLLFQSIQQALH